MNVHADAAQLLAAWSAPDHPQEALRQAYLAFLDVCPEATARSCRPGHLTASALVLSADRRSTLLTLHPRVGRWLQLGGHLEPVDATLAEAALREATEESGIDALMIDPNPIRLDVHPIVCSGGSPTRHFDVQFRAFAPVGAMPTISVESTALRFWPVDALPDGTDASVRALVTAAAARS